MKMAYSKAYKMIIRSEKDLNCKLLVGKIGGKGGGGSTLTEEARKLMSFYEQINKKQKNLLKKK
ncbi:conserved domain protein [Parvimonas sp. oral taxon 393 str. F0440]|nr:conserved domain protein [Parvimonas sp. oral taxon 393 str. F0440]